MFDADIDFGIGFEPSLCFIFKNFYVQVSS